MKSKAELLARGFLRNREAELSELEHKVVDLFLKRKQVSRNVSKDFEDDRTVGERVADKVASFGGSWTFIFLFGAVLICWVLVNSILLLNRGFDPYPYILLNLFLSMIAALQAPIIMMSQNRQAARDRLDAAHDYEVNLKAELEIRHLHEKLDELREQKWAELVKMQQEQIRILQELLEKK